VREALTAAGPLLDAGLRCNDSCVSNATVVCWTSTFAILPLSASDYPTALATSLRRVQRQAALVTPGLLPCSEEAEAEAEAEKVTMKAEPPRRGRSGSPLMLSPAEAAGGAAEPPRKLRPRKQSASQSQSQSQGVSRSPTASPLGTREAAAAQLVLRRQQETLVAAQRVRVLAEQAAAEAAEVKAREAAAAKEEKEEAAKAKEAAAAVEAQAHAGSGEEAFAFEPTETAKASRRTRRTQVVEAPLVEEVAAKENAYAFPRSALQEKAEAAEAVKVVEAAEAEQQRQAPRRSLRCASTASRTGTAAAAPLMLLSPVEPAASTAASSPAASPAASPVSAAAQDEGTQVHPSSLMHRTSLISHASYIPNASCIVHRWYQRARVFRGRRWTWTRKTPPASRRFPARQLAEARVLQEETKVRRSLVYTTRVRAAPTRSRGLVEDKPECSKAKCSRSHSGI
jgi:hypothetical protein